MTPYGMLTRHFELFDGMFYSRIEPVIEGFEPPVCATSDVIDDGFCNFVLCNSGQFVANRDKFALKLRVRGRAPCVYVLNACPQGTSPFAEIVWMRLGTQKPPAHPAPGNIRFEFVESATQKEAARQVYLQSYCAGTNANNYELDTRYPDAVFSATLASRVKRKTVLAIDDASNVAVALGSVHSDGEVAEITGVGTVPEARGQGLAAHITTQLVDHVQQTGMAEQIMLHTLAKSPVERLYTRLGFTPVFNACYCLF